jgi:N-carbamoylputrescine amidase
VFVNRVGVERGLTFGGGSHVVDPHGCVIAQAPRLEPALLMAELGLGEPLRARGALPLIDNLRPELLGPNSAALRVASRSPAQFRAGRQASGRSDS